MQIYEAVEQLSWFGPDLWSGKMSQEPFQVEIPKARISALSLKKLYELKSIPFMSLDLTPGHGNLLGEFYWELISPWRGDALTLNTGVSPREEKESSLSQILQDSPPLRYYLSQKACLGILRRAEERGKILPEQLQIALMMQAGLIWNNQDSVPSHTSHSNQKEKTFDLRECVGTVISNSDAQMQNIISQFDSATGFDGYNGDLTGEVSATLGTNCGMSTGRNGVISPIAFAANQRDEVRDLHDIAAALGAQPGMKQQTFVAGFSAGQGAKAGGVGYQEECAPTLKASESGTNMVPTVLCLNDQGGSVMECTEEKTGTLRSQEHGHQPLVYENHGIDARYTGPHSVAPTMSARYGTGGNNVPLVRQESDTFCIVGNIIDRKPKNGGNGCGFQQDIAYTLTATDHHAVFSRQRVDVFKSDDVASTQSARQHKDATDLVVQKEIFGQTQFGNYSSGCSTLRAQGGDSGGGSENLVADMYLNKYPLLIRRLTPLECERLQGFPDGWTYIPGSSDSARYKALGNSVAIPCVEFVMAGIRNAIKQGECQ